MTGTSGSFRRVVMELDELTDADVDFVSLVSRGANRAPFKIQKREELPMLNFGKAIHNHLFKSAEPVDTTPSVVAILVGQSPRTLSLVTQIEEGADYTVVEKSVGNDMTVLKIKEFVEEDALIIQMTDDIAVVVEHAKKMFNSYPDSTSYRENLSTTGFVPGFHMGMDALAMTVHKVLDESRSLDEGKSLVSTAIGEFQTHVTQLMDAVPQTAFKLESLYAEDSVKKEAPSLAIDKVAGAAAASAEAPHKGADAGGASPSEGAGGAVIVEKAGDIDTPNPEDEPDLDAKLTGMFATMTQALNGQFTGLRDELLLGLQKSDTAIETVNAEMRALKGETDSLRNERDQLQEQVSGTVAAGALDFGNTADNLSSTEDMSARRKALLDTEGEHTAGIFDSAIHFPGESRGPHVETA
jgi:hypothetical protein